MNTAYKLKDTALGDYINQKFLLYLYPDKSKEYAKLLILSSVFDNDISSKIKKFQKSIEIYPNIENIGTLSTIYMQTNVGKTEVMLFLREQYRRRQMYDYNDIGKNVKMIKPPKGHKVIILFCEDYSGSWFDKTGPSDLGGFLGGSEEAIIKFSQELASRGYWVEVFTPVKLSDQAKPYLYESGGGYVWYPIEALPFPLSKHHHFDIIISYRNKHSLFLVDDKKHRDYISAHWLQDCPDDFNEYNEIDWFVNSVDVVAVLSKFHLSLLKPQYKPKAIITPNAILDDVVCDGMNYKHRFIYASQPSRGLSNIFYFWNTVRQYIPDAELHIYYGIHQGWVNYANANGVSQDAFVTFLNNMYNTPGIIYHGPSNQTELCNGFADAGFFLYPTTYPEVGCISCMKAMANGAIPITTIHKNSTLYELTKPWDLGLEDDMEKYGNDDKAYYLAFVNRLLDVVDKDWTEHRNKMKAWAREKLRWEYSIDAWEKVLK